METNVENVATGTGDEFMNLHICKRKKKLMRHPSKPYTVQPSHPQTSPLTQPPTTRSLAHSFFLFPIRALDENLVLYQVFSFPFFRFWSCVQNENVFFCVYSIWTIQVSVQTYFYSHCLINAYLYMITRV